jgi:hypothetical protein
VVLTGATLETALKTPSAQQSGYKINGPFTVPSGASADLLLDFNACKSIVVAGASGRYLLKPVVTAMAALVSGSIAGTTIAGSHLYAEQQSMAGPVIVATARSYEIDAVATTIGPYSMGLAASGPWLGTYSTTLPIAFSQDIAAGDVGIYAVTATDAAGTASTMQANASMGPATLGFTLTP